MVDTPHLSHLTPELSQKITLVEEKCVRACVLQVFHSVIIPLVNPAGAILPEC